MGKAVLAIEAPEHGIMVKSNKHSEKAPGHCELSNNAPSIDCTFLDSDSLHRSRGHASQVP